MRLPLVATVALAVLGAGACARKAPPAPPTLVVLMGADVVSLDPGTSFDEVSSVVLGNVFEGLVRIDRNLQVVPALSHRWISPDDRTWRFFLDPRARFSDGSPLRAADVRFSIERLRSLAGSQLGGFVCHVASVEVVDDLTLDVRTDTPVAILNSLALIPVVSEAHARAAAGRVDETPLGTGPYRLVRWDKGRSIVLEANEHRRPLPVARRVEFVIRPDGVLVDDLLRLRPHLTLYLRRSLLDDFVRAKPPEMEVVWADGLSVFFLTFNLAKRLPGLDGDNPLRDLRLRRALAHAVDRERLAREPPRGSRPASQLVVPQVFGYDPSLRPPPYDPDAARRLLAEGGWSGLELSFDAPRGGSHTLEKRLIEQWEAVGVRARLREHDDDELQRALESGAFTVAIQGYVCTTADASEILTYLLHSPDPAHGWGLGNTAGYRNAEVDGIAEGNLRVFDPLQRRAQIQRALRIVSQEIPDLPLVSVQDVYVVSKAILWTPAVNGELHLEEITFAGASGTR